MIHKGGEKMTIGKVPFFEGRVASEKQELCLITQKIKFKIQKKSTIFFKFKSVLTVKKGSV